MTHRRIQTTRKRVFTAQWIREGNPHWTMHKYEPPVDDDKWSPGSRVLFVASLTVLCWGLIGFLFYG